jgi:integral membrane protein (TIGR00529 family)
LGSLLRRRGKLADMALGAAWILKSRKAALGAVPALIGMMPMPGGALLSLPMVEELDAKKELTPEEKASINYLFRHVMEFLFPLYPGMLLFASLLGSPVFHLVYALVFLLVVLLLGSGWYLDRRVSFSLPDAGVSKSSQGWKLLLSGLWPVILIVTLSLGLHLDILYALAGTLFLSALYFQAGGKKLRHSLKEGIGVETVFSILSIMVFQQVLGASEAIFELPAILASFGLPAWVPVLFLPLLVGLLTGMTIACLGLTFPVLSAYFVPPSNLMDFGMVMLAYTGGFWGIMLSPAQLCLVLTYDFFKPKKLAVYREMVIPLLLVAAAALLLFFGGFPWGKTR